MSRILTRAACLTSSVKDVPSPSCQKLQARDVMSSDSSRRGARRLVALLQGQNQGLAAVFEELLQRTAERRSSWGS